MFTEYISPLKIKCLNLPGQNLASQVRNFLDFLSVKNDCYFLENIFVWGSWIWNLFLSSWFFFSLLAKKHIRRIKCSSYSAIAINPNQTLLLVWPQDEDMLQEGWRSVLGSRTLLLKAVPRADLSWLRTDIFKQHSLEAHRRIKYVYFLVLFFFSPVPQWNWCFPNSHLSCMSKAC